jgi:hypothetical protein
MGSVEDVDESLVNHESCGFVMVQDSRQRDPVEKSTQGSLLVLLNLSLTLFLRDVMIKPESLSIPAECVKGA